MDSTRTGARSVTGTPGGIVVAIYLRAAHTVSRSLGELGFNRPASTVVIELKSQEVAINHH